MHFIPLSLLSEHHASSCSCLQPTSTDFLEALFPSAAWLSPLSPPPPPVLKTQCRVRSTILSVCRTQSCEVPLCSLNRCTRRELTAGSESIAHGRLAAPRSQSSVLSSYRTGPSCAASRGRAQHCAACGGKDGEVQQVIQFPSARSPLVLTDGFIQDGQVHACSHY